MKINPKTKTYLTGASFFVVITLLYFFYNSPILYPFRMFIVALHESSHALAVYFTGGEIISFTMLAQEGGNVIVRGGNAVLSSMSGYIGSLIIGISLLYFASVSNYDKYAVLFLAVWMFFFTVINSIDSYTLYFGLISSAFLMMIFFIDKEVLSDLLLRFIGLFSIVYVPHDIFSDTISRSHLKSDAYAISQELGLTTEIWGWIWMTISIAFIIISLKLIMNSIHNKNIKESEVIRKDKE